VSTNPHTRALAKLLEQITGRHHMHRVFADFVEMAALAIANRIDWVQREPREARYMEMAKGYDARDLEAMSRALGELVAALETGGPADVLGEVFGMLEQGNAARGQFFTPYEICRLMARMTLNDDEIRERIEARGFITMQEPAVGAGAMIIAVAEAMQERGINYQEHLHVSCVDVDARAVHMAFLQLSLLHVPAVIVLGNTLTLEEREHWYTPAHIMGLWDTRLRRGYALGSAMDVDGIPTPADTPIVLPSAGDVQLDLFGAAA
jgi:type I restriction-modification system DNA methylase subunit